MLDGPSTRAFPATFQMSQMFEVSTSEEWAERGGAQPAGLPVGIGERFPDLVLPSIETGEPLSHAGFRGGPLLLHVFASW